MIHELKTWQGYFQEVLMGYKTFDLRKDDRNFKIGDTLILKEWDNHLEVYTGREIARGISYVLKGGIFGLEEGYVILSLS